MKLIYQQAASVSVWLGGEGEEGDIAWSLLEDLDNASDTTLNAIVGDSSRFNQFQALKKIFRRRYWFRIWVAQEVTVGKSVTVYCGRHSISWGRLNEICEDLKHLKEYLIWSLYPNDPTSVFSLLSGGPKSLGLTKWSVKTQSEIQPPLLELLYAHMSKHSSDPRDKVYALVGISNSQVSFGPIDYERSLVETFTHTARHLISTTRSLDVICACQNEDVMHDLPSWAPDWERRSKYPMHRVMGLHIRRPQYETAGKDSEAIVSFSEDSRVLTARGFALDTIKEVSSTFWIDGHHKDEHKIVQTLHTFKEWWTLYSNFKGTEASLEEFNHTFCGGSWAAVYDVHDKKRLELFCALFKTLLPEHDFEHAPFPGTTAESDEDQRSTVSTASLRMHNRRLALSANEGLACLAPPTAQPGDVACILLGCNFPVLLHKVEDGYYTLVGEIYVDGKMNGEAMK
ncbi:hypothetical protein BJ875DRAFT_385069 [Amylocarpus encephaloides]|uniref:Heterokaryon incompatibility domain-containing protein n=1 Tax=Amylocarpus encephaloides TaxID=45428 RepID=A0A9P8C2Z1_9HELO|nr:hypothetical protein BJ875DRAFT_385069 [Amylocarpus encephaloides]